MLRQAYDKSISRNWRPGGYMDLGAVLLVKDHHFFEGGVVVVGQFPRA